MRFLILAAACVSLLGCATMREVVEGNPTPALAMYFAQTHQAFEGCDAPSKEPLGARALRTAADPWRKKYPHLDPLYILYRARYAEAWSAADSEKRESFCDDYAREFEELRGMAGSGYVHQAIRIFSPSSQEALERGRRIANVLSLGATLAATTASVSASRDGYKAAKAGDFSTSMELASEATAFNQVGATFNEISVNASPSTATCSARAHFSNFDAPADSEVWLTFRTTLDVLRCAD